MTNAVRAAITTLTAIIAVCDPAMLFAGPPVLLSSGTPAGGWVSTPDGSRVVYSNNYNSTGVEPGVWSVPVVGGTPTTLSSPYVDQGFIESHDGSQVFYRTNQVYRIPVTGGTSTTVTGGAGTGYPSAFQLSPDDTRIVYRDPSSQLYSVPSIGGTATPLGSVDGNYYSFGITPDASRVVYTYNSSLFSVPITGGAASTLGANVGMGFGSYKLTPDGSRVVFDSTTGSDAYDLYSVPTAGGTPIKLNASLTVTSSTSGVFRISGDGTHVAYTAYDAGVLDLYSVAATGGTPVKLAGNSIVSGSVKSFQFSPDGSHVIYEGTDPSNGRAAMYIAPTTGGPSIHLATTLCSTCVLSVNPAQFTPDGTYVLNTTRLDSPDQRDLYLFSSDGGSAVKLNTPLAAGQVVHTNFGISPDGSRAIYRVSSGELFIVPTAGGTAVHFAFDSQTFDDFSSVGWASGGSRVVYYTTVSPYRLYSRSVRLRWNQSSGDWDLPTNWDQRDTPDEVTQVTIAGQVSATATGNAAQRFVNELQLGSGPGSSILTLQSDASITAINGASIESNGVLAGNGSIVGNLINRGVVSPGTSPGTLQINGNYSQSSTGALQIELASASSFDKLLVTGNASLGGTLVVSLLSGFTPTAGQSFDALDWGTLSGRFTAVQLPPLSGALAWDTSQLYTTGTLSIAVAVPEPASLSLLAVGLMGIAVRTRKLGICVS